MNNNLIFWGLVGAALLALFFFFAPKLPDPTPPQFEGCRELISEGLTASEKIIQGLLKASQIKAEVGQCGFVTDKALKEDLAKQEFLDVALAGRNYNLAIVTVAASDGIYEFLLVKGLTIGEGLYLALLFHPGAKEIKTGLWQTNFKRLP